jgi:pimeloyl-ACP methyl ester carboxylesterase
VRAFSRSDKSGVTREAALAAAERFAAFTNVLSAAEKLIAHRELGPDGLDSVSEEVDRHALGPAALPHYPALLNTLRRRSVAVGVEVVRLGTGFALLLPIGRSGRTRDLIRGSAGLVLLASHAVAGIRRLPGGDGSDHSSSQVLLGTSIARLSRSDPATDAALWYVALQGVLSYSVAGVAKLFGKPWRDGSAIPGVMRTRSYGARTVWSLAAKYPRATKLGGWGVMLWEAMFPLALVRIPVLTRAFTGSAKAFHVFVGTTMRLQRFVWGFGGFHPAIRYVATPMSALRSQRSDSLPVVAASMTAAAILALQAATVTRRLVLRTPPPTWSRVTLSSGNEICYSGNFRGVKTVFVLLSGLGVPAETYTWLAAHLRSSVPDSGVLLVERAGYGASISRTSQTDRLGTACDDVADLLSRLVTDENVLVGVGHSLGGEVLRRLSWQRPGLFGAYILLDATNPDQFDDQVFPPSEKEGMLSRIRKDEIVTRLGFGSLMVPTIPTAELPAGYRRRADMSQRDWRLWSTSRKELLALFRNPFRHHALLFAPGSRGLVFAAATTYNSPPLKKLQDAIASEVMAGPGADATPRPIIIDGDHMDIVVRSTQAAQIAHEVSRFVTSEIERS